MAVVYRMLNPFNHRFYIGSTQNLQKRASRHVDELNKGAHHNSLIQKDHDNGATFAFETIAEVPTREEAYALEQTLITEHANNDLLYNIGRSARGGDNLTNNPCREKIISKTRRSFNDKVAAMSDDERKNKWGRYGSANPMFGRTHSEVVRERISRLNRGRTFKREPFTEEHRRKISENTKGRVGDKNSFFGKTHSEETKRRIAKSRFGKSPSNCRALCVNGVVYDSMHDAKEKLDVPVVTIRYRCLNRSPKFSNWFFV